MKLHKYDLVDGNDKILSGATELPICVISASTPTDYTEITSAENWEIYGDKVIDYIFWRYEIQVLLTPIVNPNYPTIDFSGWSALTTSEKTIMAKHILAPKALRRTIFTAKEDLENWTNLLERTKGDRERLIEKMRKATSNMVLEETLSMADTQAFFRDVYLMIEYYINAADPIFKQWLTNEVGSAYENDGFAQKSYYSSTLKDELVLIYNGEK